MDEKINVESVLEYVTKIFMSKPEAASKELEKIEEYAQKAKLTETLIEIKFKQAQIDNILGKYDQAEEKLEILYQQIKDSDDVKAKIKITNEQGNTFFALGQLEKALDAYKESISYLESSEGNEKKAIPVNNIGQIYWQLGEIDKARKCYLKAYELVKEVSPAISADALVNLGILEAEQESFDQAEEYFLKAEKLYLESDETARQPLLFSNLALLYQDKNQIDEAVKYHHLAWEGYINSGNEFGEMHAGSNYAGFLIDIDSLDNVKEILDRCLKIAEKFGLEDYKLQLYDYYRFYFQKKRKYKSAYSYLEKLHNLEIERLKSEQKQKIAESLAKFEDEQKEKEAALLREKNQKIEKQKQELDHAYKKLKNVNLELENRFENLLAKWHSLEQVTRDQEKIDGFLTMISGIAHQWKQPLNYIGIIVQNLLDAYEFDEFDAATLKDFSENIHDQLTYMANIVDDFAYSFKRMQESDEFYLSHTADIIKKLLKKTIQIENIDLQFNIENDVIIKGRESEILQVFVVLISNAIEVFKKHNQKNRKIIFDVKTKNNMIIISVFNNGAKIPEDALNHIFEAYYSTKKENSNSGLGLALAEKILKDNFNAQIKCYNQKNGVEFTITLPM